MYDENVFRKSRTANPGNIQTVEKKQRSLDFLLQA
jgi:hypothetical protein